MAAVLLSRDVAETEDANLTIFSHKTLNIFQKRPKIIIKKAETTLLSSKVEVFLLEKLNVTNLVNSLKQQSLLFQKL